LRRREGSTRFGDNRSYFAWGSLPKVKEDFSAQFTPVNRANVWPDYNSGCGDVASLELRSAGVAVVARAIHRVAGMFELLATGRNLMQLLADALR